MGISSKIQYWKKAMNEGVIKTIKKAYASINKFDNPKLKPVVQAKSPKPLAKFKSFVKSKWL